MTKIIKWLKEHGIEYRENGNTIIILLEAGCVWINGFGNPMEYNKEIHIWKDRTYKDYHMEEITGYNMLKRLCWTSKQTTIINELDKRLAKENMICQ